jgi:hypothetical protein
MIFWKNKKIQMFVIILLVSIAAVGIVLWKSGFSVEKHDINHDNPLDNNIGNITHNESTSENSSSIPTRVYNENLEYSKEDYTQNIQNTKSDQYISAKYLKNGCTYSWDRW